jgi:PAS domain-containing protein
MRDQHRDKGDLINELNNLRKQVADLKQAAAERRRLEDALRREEALLRELIDRAPVRLCLMAPTGAPLIASASFARMLGYSSPGELVRVSGEPGALLPSGVAGNPEPGGGHRVALRRRDGTDLSALAFRSGGGEEPFALAVIEEEATSR